MSNEYVWPDFLMHSSDDIPLNPDCRDGKHQACAGDAWDLKKDEPTDCGCPCHKKTVKN